MISLMLFHEWMLDSLQNIMDDIGYDMLSRQDYEIFFTLGDGGKSVFELAEILKKPIAELHLEILNLEQYGFVEFVRPVAPVLQKQIIYSQKGLQFINDLSCTVSAVETVLKDRINEGSLQKIKELLALNWGPALKASDLEQYGPVIKQKDNNVDL